MANQNNYLEMIENSSNIKKLKRPNLFIYYLVIFIARCCFLVLWLADRRGRLGALVFFDQSERVNNTGALSKRRARLHKCKQNQKEKMKIFIICYLILLILLGSICNCKIEEKIDLKPQKTNFDKFFHGQMNNWEKISQTIPYWVSWKIKIFDMKI